MAQFVFNDNLLTRTLQDNVGSSNNQSSSNNNSPDVSHSDSNNAPRLVTPSPVPVRTSQQQELIEQLNRTIREQTDRIRLLEDNNPNRTNNNNNNVNDLSTNNNSAVNTGPNSINPFVQSYNPVIHQNSTLDEIKKEKVADKYYSMINNLVELDYNREDLEELELDELVNLYSSHYCKVEQIVKNSDFKVFKERINYFMAKFHEVFNKADKYHLLFNRENKEIMSKNFKLQYMLNIYIGRLNIHYLNVTDSVIKAEITELTIYLCMIKNTVMDQGIKENNIEIGNNTVKSYISEGIGETLMNKDFKKFKKELKDNKF
ncbi:hypothetical protein ABK040_009435 [Willaertia magna]